MKRRWRKIAIALLAFILLASLCSCDLLNGGNTNNNDEIRAPKPEFKVALDNYGLLKAKRSEFEGSITISIYGKVNDRTGKPNTYSTTQRFDLTRIQNDGKIYVDGNVYNQDSSYNMESLLGSIKSALSEINKLPRQTLDTITSIIGYLDGTRSANVLLGYDSSHSSYNLKGTLKGGKQSDTLYYATNNEYIVNELLHNNIFSNIKFNDYLMFSTFVDFSGNSGWINSDEASSLFDNAKGLCNYQMSANTEKIYNYVIGLVEEYISGLDIEKYGNDIKTYTDCVNIIKGWISIGESNISASVNKDNLPVSMLTTTTININIDINELEEVLNKIFTDEKLVNDIIKKLEVTTAFLLGTSSINMSIGLSLSESFSYDNQSTSLDTVDADLFIDAKEEKAGRVSYIVRDDIEEQEQEQEQEQDN